MNLFKTIAGISIFACASFAMAASTNESPSIPTVEVTTGYTKYDWGSSTTVGEGDKLAVQLHYYLAEGDSTSNMKFVVENLAGKTFSQGDTESVSGSVSATGLSTSNGAGTVHFKDDVRLEFHGVTWQVYPCQSTACEEPLPSSYRNVTSSGMNIGPVEGWHDGNWSGKHYAGNVIVEFKAYKVTNSYDDCRLDGVTVKHGHSYTFYSTENTNGQCSSYRQVRTCNDGELSGSDHYKYATCTKDQDHDDSEVTTKNATHEDEDSARLNGEWEGDDNTEVWFAFDEHDSTPSCNSSSQKVGKQIVDDNEDFAHTVTGLDENEKYYFRACAYDDDGDVLSGSIKYFTTDEDNDDDDDHGDLSIITKSESSVDDDSARLNGEVRGEDNVDVWFAFSRTDSTPSCNSTAQKVSVSGTYDDREDFAKVVTGLSDNTRYYFRACGRDSDGDIESGSIRNFITNDDDRDHGSDIDADVITNVASGITTSSARLNSIVIGEDDAVCYFQYGRSSSLGWTTSRVAVDLDDESTCSSIRTGLSSNTLYYYRAVLEQDGETHYGSTRTFRTNATTVYRPPVTNTNTNVTIVNRNATIADELEITKWVSAENDPRFDVFTQAVPGETVYYKVRVENNTGEDLDDIVVVDRIPYYLELDEDRDTDDDDDKQVRWVIDLDDGDSRTFITEMRVREDSRRGDIIVSYASATADDYSANSNDVEIEVVGLFDYDDEDADQSANIFGSGIFPDTLVGWCLLILILLAIAYFISRLMVARNENQKVLAELEAARARSHNG